MLIINQKRIKIILGFLLISLFTFSCTTVKNQNNNVTTETVETTATQVSGKTVILDAGHGTPDEGAEAKDGTTEAQTNLKITLKVQKLLEQSGCEVLLTRSDDEAIYDLDSIPSVIKSFGDLENMQVYYDFFKFHASDFVKNN